jgi:outer membrane protein TolC
MRILIFLLFPISILAQDLEEAISFSEYINLVKSEHPIAKQANLKIDEGNATLTKARGGFDPKLEGDFNTKEFKDKEYYDQLNAKLKIPTWYGIELQAGFEENSGVFLNPENNVPNNGLYNAGISASLGQGLFINKRMADLKKAKAYQNQTLAERELLLNNIIFEASLAYFNWNQSYDNLNVYKSFLENANFRFKGIKKQVLVGDKAPIDSLEALIIVDNRKLQLEQAKIDYNTSTLEVSNYLWLNNTPVEIKENIRPLEVNETNFNQVLNSDLSRLDILNHPKIKALDFKTEALELDRRLKANKLLPKIDLAYNFVTQQPEEINSFYNTNYKAKIGVAFPLFLRKERGDLKLAKIKLEAIKFDTESTRLSIENKVKALMFEVDNYKNQVVLIEDIAKNYQELLTAEERKFNLGESAIFLVNSREKSLIDARIKVNSLKNKYLSTKTKLYNSLGLE